jgi:FkbM family methyltransferase
MLISGLIISDLLNKYNIVVKGVLHIGAHECEEKGFYNHELHVQDDAIVWVDGNPTKVEEMKQKGCTTIYQAVLDETERDVVFNITDNSQASSILTLNHEQGFYNNIHIVKQLECKTETLSHFFKRIGKSSDQYNFWNLDIQGSELSVMRGSAELLEGCDAIYTEVNAEHVYHDCGLIDELDAFLSQYGFKRVYTLWTDVKWGDALYVKTTLALDDNA